MEPMDMPESPKTHIAVIGAGVIGSCCALRLRRDGNKVTLIDQLPPGQGCSYGNAGAISPAAVVPMALPGMWKKVPRWLFDPDGPLSVRWSYLPKAAPWLVRWLLATRRDVVIQASRALFALNGGTLEGYRELLTAEQYQDLIRGTGHLYVYRKKPTSPGDLLAAALREMHSIRVDTLNGDDLRQIEPALSDQFNSGIFFPDNCATGNPGRLVETVASNFLAEGGTLLQDKVDDIRFVEDERVVLETRSTSLTFDAVVVAAGAWSKRFLPDADKRVPLETERGYHMMLRNSNIMPRCPTMAGDYKFYASPMEEGLRLAGTVEFSGLVSAPNWKRAEILLKHAKEVFPGLEGRGSTVWVGQRPSIPDSVPVIGRSKAHPNLFVAFGHGHLGMSGGPGTSQLVADMVAGRKPQIDPAPYSISRF